MSAATRTPTPDLSVPERTCLVTRRSGPAENLVRFVVDPEDRIVPDISGKLPGRGYWVTATRAMVERAVKGRAFENAVARARKNGTPVAVDPDLGRWVEELLTGRSLEYLGLARKAGQVVTGFEKVKAFMGARPDAVLVEATDGSTDGERKILAGARDAEVVRRFSRDQLSLALGRENVVHAAVEATGIGARFVEMAGRLERYAPAPVEDAGTSQQGPTGLSDKARQYE